MCVCCTCEREKNRKEGAGISKGQGGTHHGKEKDIKKLGDLLLLPSLSGLCHGFKAVTPSPRATVSSSIKMAGVERGCLNYNQWLPKC